MKLDSGKDYALAFWLKSWEPAEKDLQSYDPWLLIVPEPFGHMFFLLWYIFWLEKKNR